MLRAITGYFAASLIGAAIYRTWYLLFQGRSAEFFILLSLNTIAIGIIVLPFWLIFIALARKTNSTTLPFYLTAGAVIGGLIEPLLLSVFPHAMWESGPTLDYGTQLLQILRVNGMIFTIMGVTASFCYRRFTVAPTKR